MVETCGLVWRAKVIAVAAKDRPVAGPVSGPSHRGNAAG